MNTIRPAPKPRPTVRTPLTPATVLEAIAGRGWTNLHAIRERMGAWTDHTNVLLGIIGQLERAKLVQTRNQWPSAWGFGFEVREVKGEAA